MMRFMSATTVLCLLAGSVLAATPSSGRDKALRLYLTAAADRNCNGDLSDETEEDAAFGVEKLLEAGQCLIYRTDYSNDGDFAIRKVEVRTPVPKFMVYLEGTADHVATPPGLWPIEPKPPAGGRDGDLVWPFNGGLAPGEFGRIEFVVKLQPVSEKMDFFRKAAE